jgi:hypothetical protein
VDGECDGGFCGVSGWALDGLRTLFVACARSHEQQVAETLKEVKHELDNGVAQASISEDIWSFTAKRERL